MTILNLSCESNDVHENRIQSWHNGIIRIFIHFLHRLSRLLETKRNEAMLGLHYQRLPQGQQSLALFCRLGIFIGFLWQALQLLVELPHYLGQVVIEVLGKRLVLEFLLMRQSLQLLLFNVGILSFEELKEGMLGDLPDLVVDYGYWLQVGGAQLSFLAIEAIKRTDGPDWWSKLLDVWDWRYLVINRRGKVLDEVIWAWMVLLILSNIDYGILMG